MVPFCKYFDKSQCCCCSVTMSCPTLCDPMDCSTPGSSVLHYLPMVPQTHVHQVDDAIQTSHPLSSLSPPAFSLTQCQSLFQWFGSWHQVYWSFSFSLSPSNEYSGLISFRTDWFDHLVVQGTLHTFIDRQIHRSVRAIDLKYFQWRITFYFKGRVITMCQVLCLSV